MNLGAAERGADVLQAGEGCALAAPMMPRAASTAWAWTTSPPRFPPNRAGGPPARPSRQPAPALRQGRRNLQGGAGRRLGLQHYFRLRAIDDAGSCDEKIHPDRRRRPRRRPGAACQLRYQKAAESAKEQARSVSVVTVASREIQGGLAASGASWVLAGGCWRSSPRSPVIAWPRFWSTSAAAQEGSASCLSSWMTSFSAQLLYPAGGPGGATEIAGRRGPGSSQPGRRPR